MPKYVYIELEICLKVIKGGKVKNIDTRGVKALLIGIVRQRKARNLVLSWRSNGYFAKRSDKTHENTPFIS